MESHPLYTNSSPGSVASTQESLSFPVVSLVIPTHNRCASLRKVLESLERQTTPPEQFEVVVICDGCTDDSAAMCRALAVCYRLRIIEQTPNQGPAAARNRGVEESSAPLILFIDDDVVAEPTLIAEHLRLHAEDGRAVVIGPLLAPPDFRLNPWTEWEEVMLDKQYEAMNAREWSPTPRQFYTGNASVRREHILKAGGFDPNFRRAEDVELAFRFSDLDLHFYFNPEAKGWHYARRSLRAWLNISTAYGSADLAMYRSGRESILPRIAKEFCTRQRPLQRLAQLCLGRPWLLRPVVGALLITGWLTTLIGQQKVAYGAYSAIFNLRYWQSVCEQIGGAAAFWALVQQQRTSTATSAGTGTAIPQSNVNAALKQSDEHAKSAYRIDFALITLTGNLTRYLLLRPIVEQDPTILPQWYPIRTWIQGDWVHILPGKLGIYVRHLLDSWRFYVRSPAQAAVIHAFETYHIYAFLRRLLHRKVLIIQNPDGGLPGPIPGPRGWLRRLAIEETAFFVPWSTFAASRIKQAYPNLPNDRFIILHPGIDLTRWQARPQPPPSERFRLLFVAGNLMLKGADTLLEAFETRLSDSCELIIATQTVYLPEEVKTRILNNPHIQLHLDLLPGSPELIQLYREADVFISPSNSDTSSWVALEALAIGVPVIICPQGGIPEIVIHEKTGLHIPPKNPQEIVAAVERLRADPTFCRNLGTQGRAHIEEHFDAHKNTRRLLELAKTLIDGHRQHKS